MMITGGILLGSGYFLFANKEDSITKEGIEEQIQAVIADGVFTKKEREHIGRLADKHGLSKEHVFADINTRIEAITEDAETEIVDQDKKKGDDFEKFIIKKFNQKFYKIKQWASDKYVDGIYSEENLQPDIIVEFNLGDFSKKVAVECKYRSKNNEKFKISYEEQLARYKEYEKKNDVDVYIALGIAGKAYEPKELYLIPLKAVISTSISKKELETYKKEVGANFFLDPKNGVLNIAYPPSNRNKLQ